MIFGSDGTNMSGSNGFNFFSDGSSQVRTGNTIIDGTGSSVSVGDMLSTPRGIVSHSGDAYYAPEGTYTRAGNTLYGPGGETWSGITSDADVESIIAHRHSKR